MRILYVANRINANDGSSVHCRSFVDSAVQLGHEVKTYPERLPVVETLPGREVKRKKNFRYYMHKLNWQTLMDYLHRSNPFVSELLWYLEGVVRGKKQVEALSYLLTHFPADAIIYRNQPFNFAPFRAAEQVGIPVIQEINSLRTMEAPLAQRRSSITALSRWAERRAIRAATRNYTVSTAIKKVIDACAGSNQCIVIPNGVDIDFFNPEANDRKTIRANLGLNGRKVIGYVGSYKNWHGLETSLDTLTLLLQRDPDYHLLFVGSGPCFRSIRADIRRKGLDKRVTQVQSVPHEAVPIHMAAFDVALMSYPAFDSFYFSPLKLFEYMAMQLPVVTTDIGQMGEILKDGTNGVLVASPEPERFAQAVEFAYGNRSNIGHNARELMISQYSWTENARRAAALAEEALRG